MTFLSRFLILLLAFVAGPVFAGPTITTPQATDIAGGGVKLTVKVSANGSATTVKFSYGTTAAYGSSIAGTPVLAAGDANVAVAATVTGLTVGTTYQFKVDATNSDGTVTTRNHTFKQQTDSPTLTIDDDPTHSGNSSTVHGTAYTAGVAGEVFFKYGADATYGMETAHTAVAANASISVDLPLTPVGATYHYQFFFTDAGGTVTVGTPDALNNQTPKAVADAKSLATVDPVTIDVLANDTDPENDVLSLVSVTTPKNGTAAISGTEIEYTPGANFRDGDTFNYTMQDSFGARSTATVTIRTLRSSLAGTHGGIVKKANGKEIGYFTLTTSAKGSFTGVAVIDGKRYAVSGVLGADGSFTGFASGESGSIPVTFATKTTDTGSVITATFDNGSYTADLAVAATEGTTRATLNGRYTLGLAAGGTGPTNGNDAGTAPAGSGWGAIRARYDGTASIKGRLPDGRSFAARGAVDIVDGTPTFTFYDDPEGTRVVGNLTLGDTVGGTIRTDEHSSGEGRFPRGFDLTQTAEGAKYVKPQGDQRVLDTTTSKGQDLTISFAGDGLPGTIARQLELDDHDHVRVVDRGSENLKVTIDRSSGRFQAKITIDTAGTRIKATGVLIQASDGGTGGRGIGVFNTSTNTGTVTIAAGSTTTTTTGTTTTGTTGTTPVTP
jgi:hypothetical protein